MEKNNEYLEKLVHINRITKVVKGGRRFGFSALVVVGNQNGKIGIAHAKAKQVPDVFPFPEPIPLPTLIFFCFINCVVFSDVIILFFQLFLKFFYFLYLKYFLVNFVLIMLSSKLW